MKLGLTIRKQIRTSQRHACMAAALLAMAGCNVSVTLSENEDAVMDAGGTPVALAEVSGHCLKLIADGEPEIRIRPEWIQWVWESLPADVAGDLASFPALDADSSFCLPISEEGLELSESEHAPGIEQADGSLLFESGDLIGFLGMGYDSTPSNMTMKLWLYRQTGSEDIRFQVSFESTEEMPPLDAVTVGVIYKGTVEFAEQEVF